jgi:hypothetical protein
MSFLCECLFIYTGYYTRYGFDEVAGASLHAPAVNTATIGLGGVTMPKHNSTASATSDKPGNPCPTFPCFPMRRSFGPKKIRGKTRCFRAPAVGADTFIFAGRFGQWPLHAPRPGILRFILDAQTTSTIFINQKTEHFVRGIKPFGNRRVGTVVDLVDDNQLLGDDQSDAQKNA